MQITSINTWNNNASNTHNKQWSISRKIPINKSKYKIIYCPGCVMFIHVVCLWICVLLHFSFVCLHVFAYAFKFKVHCGSAFEPGPGHSRATLLLYTTCVHSCCNWRATCVTTPKKKEWSGSLEKETKKDRKKKRQHNRNHKTRQSTTYTL